MTDARRLPDPSQALARLPRGAGIILRHTDAATLEALARRVQPHAQALGLKVLLAGDPGAALRLGCDGVHLSEARARSGPLRIASVKPGFIITAAAHDRIGLWRAARAGAQLVMLSPVFPTQSHPGARTLGAVRFARLARLSTTPIVALGGVTSRQSRRLALGPCAGLAAIDAWMP